MLDQQDPEDSPPTHAKFIAASPAKLPTAPVPKFITANEEISEAVLAKGFRFQPKAPPRPGQFTERPKPKASPVSEAKPDGLILSDEGSSNSRSTFNGTHPLSHGMMHRQRAPLDLPELRLISQTPRSQTQNSAISTQATLLQARIGSYSSQPLGPVESGKHHHTASQHKQLTETAREITSGPSPDASKHGSPTESHNEFPTAKDRLSEPPNPPPFLNHCQGNQSTRSRLEEKLFDDLQALPTHVKRTGVVEERHSSPFSHCGDLESPGPKRASQRSFLHNNHRSPVANRSAGSGSPRYSSHPQRRSDSRNSNISRKRSGVSKHRSRVHPERKRDAMHQVAQYWNECMQIAEEEKLQAGNEIRDLQEVAHY